MWPFKKKQDEDEWVRYMPAYACENNHCSCHENGGICETCGEPTRLAVCRGGCFMGQYRPFHDGFVRWITDESGQEET